MTPNTFSSGISRLEWQMLSEDDHVPLMNKVTQGLYPPGSTVKPMHGLALMTAGVDPNDHVNCSGVLRVGTGLFHCHSRRGHGAVDLKRAIIQSCDIYFFEMIRRLGYDRIAPVARAMGLGQKFELPFGTQRYGTVPDSAWKLRKYKDTVDRRRQRQRRDRSGLCPHQSVAAGGDGVAAGERPDASAEPAGPARSTAIPPPCRSIPSICGSSARRCGGW